MALLLTANKQYCRSHT